MKITEARLKELFMEELKPTLEEVMKELGVETDATNYHGEQLPPPDMLGDPDYEGEMARVELRTASKYACELTDMLKNTDQLPAWIQAKISKASDYLTVARNYLVNRSELESGRVGHGPHHDKPIETGDIEIHIDEELDEKKLTKAQMRERDRIAKEVKPKTKTGKDVNQFAVATAAVQKQK
jgi:hypothetical protein